MSEEQQEEIVETAEHETEKKPERKPIDVTISDIELGTLKEEREEFKGKYLRLLADAENARRRLQKDRNDIIQYAINNLIADFLHPIDHMENALKFTGEASDEVKHWATGFQMILTQLKDVLANNGVKPIEAVGKVFDPHFHEAIEMVVTDEYEPGMVIEESTKGYMIADKVLRPSRVKVSKKLEEEKQKQE